MRRVGAFAGGLAMAALGAGAALAQDAAGELQPATETARFAFSTLLFLLSGMTVMFMAAGFCMLGAGLARAKNAATTCAMHIAAFAVAGIMVWLIGYNLIYAIEPGGFLGEFAIWGADDSSPLETGHAAGAHWHFQMAFVAVAAAIVAGALAERVRLWSFLIFIAILTGLIYPIQASWTWGGGFLKAQFGFFDFAGATLVHAAGGWAALAGALVVGPRAEKYSGGKVHPMPGSNLPLAALGAFILCFGWLGVTGGSQLAFGAASDAIAVARIFVNTNMAVCGGVLVAMALTQLIYKKVDLTLVLNGAIGGLVSITAAPLDPAIWQALMIGGIGGVIVTISVPALDRLKIDDVVGAIPAHLLCGVWGTLIAAWTNESATVFGQIAGVAITGAFVFTTSALAWLMLRYSIGVRANAEQERQGLDRVELGLDSYPEFGKG